MDLQIFYHIKELADKWQDAFREFPGVCVAGDGDRWWRGMRVNGGRRRTAVLLSTTKIN